jgi:hypothetical protein
MGLKDFLKGEEAEAAADDAIARRASAQKKRDDLDTVGIALAKEQADIEEQIGRTGDDAKAKKLAERLKEIDLLRTVNNQRKKVAAQECDKADLDLRKARTVNRVKVIRKHTGTRAKAADKMTSAIAALYEGWSEFHAANQKLVLFAGGELGINGGFGGTLLSRDETRQKVEQHLAKISLPPPLTPGAVPALPGARLMALSGDPAKLKSLNEEVESANEYLARKAENIPTPAATAERKEQPKQAAPADVDDAILNSSAPTGPLLDASQIQAAIRPVKLA